MPRSAPPHPDVKPSRNGQAKQSSHSEPGTPMAPEETSTSPSEASPSFPHVSSPEEGLAAPGDTIARPVHPTLGGSLYASGVPARDSRYGQNLTDRAYKRLEEDHPLRAAGLRVLQDDARHATQITRETLQSFLDELTARQRKAEAARAEFAGRASQVQSEMARATERERASLARVDEEIARTQRLAMLAPARPGVPRASARRTSSLQTQTAEAAENKTSGTKVSAAPSGSSEQVQEPADPASFTPLWIKISKIGLGTVVGVALGQNTHFLSLHQLLRFQPNALAWMVFWMAAGAYAVSLLTQGLGKWWEYAGERRTEEPPVTDVVHWRAVRHAAPPLMATVVACAMEASVLRNAQVASPLVRDPGNWTYLLGNLALILPATIHAGTSGWTRGCARKERQMHAARAEEAAAEARVQVEETIITSAEAQTAFALDDQLETLREQRAEHQATIAAQEAHYQTLLSHYIAEMEAPTALSDEQKRIVDGLKEDAKAANGLYKQKHAQYEDALDELPERAATPSLTLCFVRTTNGDLIAAPQPPPKLSVWQRSKAFLGWLRDRLTSRGKGETA